MASARSPYFHTPLSLYSALVTRPKAIKQARELERRRAERACHLARYKADQERVIDKNKQASVGARP
jgi:hypothetical protein